MKYCKKCGAARSTQIGVGGYDENTGLPNVEMMCSVNPCHTEHDWDFNHPDTRGVRGVFFMVMCVCRRCGEKKYHIE